MKIVINPKYNYLTPHIRKWCSPTYFSSHGECIIHKDLNINNILYHTSASGEYLFSLIDTNRMSFHSSLSERERIHNLKRLSCSTVAYTYILERYAYHTKADSLKIQFIGFISRAAFEVRVWYKQHIKQNIKKLLNLHMM